MRHELNSFVEKMELKGVPVKYKKQYIKLANNVVAIATNKKIKFSFTDKVHVNGLTELVEDCAGKFPLGRYKRRVTATNNNLTSILEQVEDILTTQDLS